MWVPSALCTNCLPRRHPSCSPMFYPQFRQPCSIRPCWTLVQPLSQRALRAPRLFLVRRSGTPAAKRANWPPSRTELPWRETADRPAFGLPPTCCRSPIGLQRIHHPRALDRAAPRLTELTGEPYLRASTETPVVVRPHPVFLLLTITTTTAIL